MDFLAVVAVSDLTSQYFHGVFLCLYMNKDKKNRPRLSTDFVLQPEPV